MKLLNIVHLELENEWPGTHRYNHIQKSLIQQVATIFEPIYPVPGTARHLTNISLISSSQQAYQQVIIAS